MELIKLTPDNIEQEHICCAIANNKDIQVMCHPAFVKDIDVNKADWYCMIARKNYSQDA